MYRVGALMVLLAFGAFAEETTETATNAPTQTQEVAKKPTFGFTSLGNGGENVFNFMKDFITSGQANAQAAWNRLKTESERRKKLLDEITGIMESATIKTA